MSQSYDKLDGQSLQILHVVLGEFGGLN